MAMVMVLAMFSAATSRLTAARPASIIWLRSTCCFIWSRSCVMEYRFSYPISFSASITASTLSTSSTLMLISS